MILASIPTGQGQARRRPRSPSRRASATASRSVSILNSSNRRPLRGGYWVVYTGPYPTLGDGQQPLPAVHCQWLRVAYVRQLIVYKKKGKRRDGGIHLRRDQRAGRSHLGNRERSRRRLGARAAAVARAPAACAVEKRCRRRGGHADACSRRVKPKSLQVFARQLATMIEAGVQRRRGARHARGADRRQVPERGRRRGARRRRVGPHPLQGARAPPEGVQPPLRLDGGSRRVVGNPRHRARPRRDPDREGHEAAAPRQGRDGLPDGRHLVRDARPDLHAHVHRAGVPERVRAARTASCRCRRRSSSTSRTCCAATGSSSSR